MKKKLGTLYYDTNKEEGAVEIDFEELPNDVVGLDILSDWASDLTKIYNRELNFVFKKESK